MKYVSVKFNGSGKEYWYKTQLVLKVGKTYTIIVDNKENYRNTPVVVTCIMDINPGTDMSYKSVRTITKTVEVKGRRPNDRLKKVVFDESAGVTVALWDDGTKTIIRCQEGDTFDKEKAIALCYMKKTLGNRGSFNETLKKWVK